MTAGPTAGGAPRPPNEHPTRLVPVTTRTVGIAMALVLAIIVLAIAVKYRSGSERRRYDAILKSSLDRIVTAQEGFYYDSTRYAVALRALPTVTLPPGVHV